MPATPLEAITNCPIFFDSGVGTPQDCAEGQRHELDDRVKAENKLRRFLASIGVVARTRKYDPRWASRFSLREVGLVIHFLRAG
jgi:hypothetical protein